MFRLRFQPCSLESAGHKWHGGIPTISLYVRWQNWPIRAQRFHDKDVTMLVSLLALVVSSFDAGWTSLKTGWQSLVVEPTGLVVPEEPSTITLALVAAVTLSVYALSTGYRRRRAEPGRFAKPVETSQQDSATNRRDAA
jgi:hypothetical protein